MERIRIGDHEYELKISKKATRSLRLRLREKNVIEISCNWLTPKLLIERFLRNNREWIEKQNSRVGRKKKLKELKYITILGKEYEIETKESLRDSLVIIENKIFINFEKEENIKKIIDKKMRILAGKLIKEKCEELANKRGLSYRRVGIKNQSSRFGSCSHQGSLNFNWQIILFPVDKFEHVIWHELAHLTVKNHSKDFWELLGKYDNNWRENNRWLKKEATKRFIV